MTFQHKRIAQSPAYLKSFQCIGSSCPDTCCAGWQVDIDKTNYKKLRQLKKGQLVDRINKHIELVESPKSSRYARIKLNADLSCPMLTDEKLCSIQQGLGAEFLSRVCHDYPRQYTAIGNSTQLLATLSCPEAARLCLLNQQGWSLSEMSLDIPPGKQIPHTAGFRCNAELEVLSDFRMRNFELLQSFALKVVQHRSLFMWQRLLLIGLVCERISSLPHEGTIEEIDRQVEMLVLQANIDMMDGSFRKQTESLVMSKGILLAQQTFIKRMNDERLIMNLNSEGEFVINETFMTCVAEAFLGLEYDTTDLESSAERLMIASENFAKFEAQHPYILENFVSNMVALDVFPYSEHKAINEQWRNLMIRYAMVRFYLIGMQAMHGEHFSVDHCVKLIYSFSKTVQHNELFLPRINDFLKAENLDSLATTAILVR